MDTKKNPYEKICKYEFCKKTFIGKRTNQEYCCKDHNIKENNRKAKETRDLTKPLNNQLLLNRRIIKIMERKNIVSLDELKKFGFKISIYTANKKIENSTKKILIYYDYILEQLDGDNFKIRKNE